jgi:hypothetical protein
VLPFKRVTCLVEADDTASPRLTSGILHQIFENSNREQIFLRAYTNCRSFKRHYWDRQWVCGERRSCNHEEWTTLLSVSCELLLKLALAPSWVYMGHLLKLKCAPSRLNIRILSSTSVPYTLTTVQVPNLELTRKKRITVHDFKRRKAWYFYALR